ncbi:hypothetical protein A0H81_09144 [Grifola frondosa]|uniref:Uncharacterized protein n=1 Tax=Grifola frondosa TaxID=5627 RepID=A0A1C7M755_GRIFR|nr:hypothetical protein A0H81_09144 [Grifola frondosa]
MPMLRRRACSGAAQRCAQVHCPERTHLSYVERLVRACTRATESYVGISMLISQCAPLAWYAAGNTPHIAGGNGVSSLACRFEPRCASEAERVGKGGHTAEVEEGDRHRLTSAGMVRARYDASRVEMRANNQRAGSVMARLTKMSGDPKHASVPCSNLDAMDSDERAREGSE